MAARFGATIVPFGAIGEDDIAERVAVMRETEGGNQSGNMITVIVIERFCWCASGRDDDSDVLLVAERDVAAVIPISNLTIPLNLTEIVTRPCSLVLDYNDIMRIPLLRDYIRRTNKDTIRLRGEMSGEVANQDFYAPALLPKLPGRFYYLFGKPIQTKGREKELKNKESANEMYLHIKSEIECSMAYLIKKREEDPYRGIIDRTVYRAISAPVDQVPTFEP
ncbi:unnamed protein product [Ilex paraguariensis]|uniref:Uncharacterized protein n=1 Tax=Ilex paraguariensis TaxID=185542 RepID=A0ABC8QXW2_9AQUA